MKISIFSYLYPPDKGVGGRRWGIFSKELAALGHEVVVTTCNTSNDKKIRLQKESTKNLQFRFFEASKFAKTQTKSFSGKIVWHLLKQIRRLNAPGWIYDSSIGISGQLETYIQSDISSGVDIIVVSCAPFRWSYIIGQELQKTRNGPRLIIDLRDPWTKNDLGYFHNLSSFRLRQEKTIEQIATANAHGISVAHEEMLSHYPNTNQIFLPNNVRIPNGQWVKKNVDEELHLVFPGTLYRDGFDALEAFIESCSNALSDHLIVLHVLGHWSSDNLAKLNSLCRVEYYGIVDRELVPSIISKSHFVVTYVSPLLPYAINTKIIEAIENRKPVILLGNPSFQDFINENNIGWVFDPSWSPSVLKDLLASASQFGPFVDPRFDISNAVQSLESFLQSAVESNRE